MCVSRDVVDVDLVTEEAADTTEALAELVAVAGLISNELNLNTVLFIIQQQPVDQRLTADHVALDVSVRVSKSLSFLFLGLSEQMNFGFALHWVSDLVAHNW